MQNLVKIFQVEEGKVLGTADLREGETFGNTYQTAIDASKRFLFVA